MVKIRSIIAEILLFLFLFDDNVFVPVDPRNLTFNFGHNLISDRQNIFFFFVHVAIDVVNPRNQQLTLSPVITNYALFRQHAASIYGFVRSLVCFILSKKKFRPLLSKVGR